MDARNLAKDILIKYSQGIKLNGENYNIEPIIDILTLFKIQQVERGSLSRIKCDGDAYFFIASQSDGY